MIISKIKVQKIFITLIVLAGAIFSNFAFAQTNDGGSAPAITEQISAAPITDLEIENNESLGIETAPAGDEISLQDNEVTTKQISLDYIDNRINRLEFVGILIIAMFIMSLIFNVYIFAKVRKKSF